MPHHVCQEGLLGDGSHQVPGRVEGDSHAIRRTHAAHAAAGGGVWSCRAVGRRRRRTRDRDDRGRRQHGGTRGRSGGSTTATCHSQSGHNQAATAAVVGTQPVALGGPSETATAAAVSSASGSVAVGGPNEATTASAVTESTGRRQGGTRTSRPAGGPTVVGRRCDRSPVALDGYWAGDVAGERGAASSGGTRPSPGAISMHCSSSSCTRRSRPTILPRCPMRRFITGVMRCGVTGSRQPSCLKGSRSMSRRRSTEVDEVVVFLRFRGRARGSDAELEAPMAHVWTIRDGKATRLRQFLDRAQALEAVGLSE